MPVMKSTGQCSTYVTQTATASAGPRGTPLLRALVARRRAGLQRCPAMAAEAVPPPPVGRHVAMNRRGVLRDVQVHRRDEGVRCATTRPPGLETLDEPMEKLHW